MTSLHEALRLVRIFHDMNQNELAKQLHISKSYLSEIESGKKTVTIELLEKYSAKFNIPISSLMLFSEKLKSKSIAETTRLFAADKVLKIMAWLATKGE